MNKRYVLSAAHCAFCDQYCNQTNCHENSDCIAETCCVPSYQICFKFCKSGHPSHVVVKEHNIHDDTDGQSHIEICNWHVYEYYSHTRNNEPRYDFSLISLKKSILFDSKAVPACLPTSDEMGKANFLVGKKLKTSGWGSFLRGQIKTSDVLREFDLVGSNDNQCHKEFDEIFPEWLCAGAKFGSGRATCHGDSGGPLTYTDKYGVTTVVGITSFGRYNPYNKACVSGIPQMYARVTSALDWITKTMHTKVEQCTLYKIVL